MPASNRYYQEQTEVKVWLHHTYRHTTEECIILKDQIERLIRKDTSASMLIEEGGVGTENANEIRGDDEVIGEVDLEKGVTK